MKRLFKEVSKLNNRLLRAFLTAILTMLFSILVIIAFIIGIIIFVSSLCLAYNLIGFMGIIIGAIFYFTIALTYINYILDENKSNGEEKKYV